MAETTPGSTEQRSGKRPGSGFGGGSLLVAGFALGGVVALAGWGLVQLNSAEGGPFWAAISTEGEVAAEGPESEASTPESTEGSTPATSKTSTPAPTVPAEPTEDESPVSQPSEAPTSALPAEPAKASEPTSYIVQVGDTLAELSGETGVPIDLLIAVNGIVDPNLIYAGATLLIPPAG